MTSQSSNCEDGVTDIPPEGSRCSLKRKLSDTEIVVNVTRAANFSLDPETISSAVENLNLAVAGVIPKRFDLETIYKKKSFELEYLSPKLGKTTYKLQDVRFPQDSQGQLLAVVLLKVFSEPVNCAYFDADELNMIFNMMSISSKAQFLLYRLVNRKRHWLKVESIKYPDIADDLSPYLSELKQVGLLENNTGNEDIKVLLNLLQLDKLRMICKSMNVNNKGTKPVLIAELIKLGENKKSLFPGMKTPRMALIKKVMDIVGVCVRVTEALGSLLDRILMLLIPNLDPRKPMMEAFHVIASVQYGERIFPPANKTKFPIFRNRQHLLDYTEARANLLKFYQAEETKNWNSVREIGSQALVRLGSILHESEKRPSTLPNHINHFESFYVWAKILGKSVDSFKKIPEGIDTAAEFLHLLIRERSIYLGNPVRWYKELALIEMHYRKNLETSAHITLKGLERVNLTETEVASLCERARILLGRNKNISDETKENLRQATEKHRGLIDFQPAQRTIEANAVQGNITGSKSTWCIETGGSNKAYARVEEIALLDYSKEGFIGIHCEGALPITLFATLFWDEIYQIPVPGAIVSEYQEAPLDLFTSNFFENRNQEIERKLLKMEERELEDFSTIMSDNYAANRHYFSLINGELFKDPEDFKSFVKCLGKKGVLKICEKIAKSYSQWKAGFPDLVMWNQENKTCKIVEVKGPGDTLSIKQKVWIKFLESLDIDVEVCNVENRTKKY